MGARELFLLFFTLLRFAYGFLLGLGFWGWVFVRPLISCFLFVKSVTNLAFRKGFAGNSNADRQEGEDSRIGGFWYYFFLPSRASREGKHQRAFAILL